MSKNKVKPDQHSRHLVYVAEKLFLENSASYSTGAGYHGPTDSVAGLVLGILVSGVMEIMLKAAVNSATASGASIEAKNFTAQQLIALDLSQQGKLCRNCLTIQSSDETALDELIRSFAPQYNRRQVLIVKYLDKTSALGSAKAKNFWLSESNDLVDFEAMRKRPETVAGWASFKEFFSKSREIQWRKLNWGTEQNCIYSHEIKSNTNDNDRFNRIINENKEHRDEGKNQANYKDSNKKNGEEGNSNPEGQHRPVVYLGLGNNKDGNGPPEENCQAEGHQPIVYLPLEEGRNTETNSAITPTVPVAPADGPIIYLPLPPGGAAAAEQQTNDRNDEENDLNHDNINRDNYNGNNNNNSPANVAPLAHSRSIFFITSGTPALPLALYLSQRSPTMTFSLDYVSPCNNLIGNCTLSEGRIVQHQLFEHLLESAASIAVGIKASGIVRFAEDPLVTARAIYDYYTVGRNIANNPQIEQQLLAQLYTAPNYFPNNPQIEPNHTIEYELAQIKLGAVDVQHMSRVSYSQVN
jgi:hypothetical protein